MTNTKEYKGPLVIPQDQLIEAFYANYDVSIEAETGQVIIKPKFRLSPDEKIDRMAELLFQEVKDNIKQLENMSTADNSDMLGIDEFDIYKQIVIKMLKYWKA